MENTEADYFIQEEFCVSVTMAQKLDKSIKLPVSEALYYWWSANNIKYKLFYWKDKEKFERLGQKNINQSMSSCIPAWTILELDELLPDNDYIFKLNNGHWGVVRIILEQEKCKLIMEFGDDIKTKIDAYGEYVYQEYTNV